MRIRDRLFRQSPYEGFDPTPHPDDFQGWGSDHPMLKDVIRICRPAIVCEVGSWKGRSAINMAQVVKTLGLETEIVCVDTWLGSPEHWLKQNDSNFYDSLRIKSGIPTLYYTFLSNIVRHGVSEIVTPFPTTSENAAAVFERLRITFDLIYIDAAHEYGAVMRDLEAYYDLLSPNGLIVGDDYPKLGVTRAVNEFANSRGLEVWRSGGKYLIPNGSVNIDLGHEMPYVRRIISAKHAVGAIVDGRAGADAAQPSVQPLVERRALTPVGQKATDTTEEFVGDWHVTIVNRRGSVEHFYHFLLGFFVPLVYHLSIEWSQVSFRRLLIRSCGPLDRLIHDLEDDRIEIIDRDTHGKMTEAAPDSTGLRFLTIHGCDLSSAYDKLKFTKVRDVILSRDKVQEEIRVVAGNWRRRGARILLVERASSHPYYRTQKSEVFGSGARRRSIPNHEELLQALLADHPGCRNVRAEDHSLIHQIALFSLADIIIAQHGAALANMIWARPSATVIEIAPTDLHRPKMTANLFSNLANCLGLRYVRLTQSHRDCDVDTGEMRAVVAQSIGKGRFGMRQTRAGSPPDRPRVDTTTAAPQDPAPVDLEKTTAEHIHDARAAGALITTGKPERAEPKPPVRTGGAGGAAGSTPDLLFRPRTATRRALLDSISQWEKVGVRGRWLANSHPKSGTHLVRNILLHFNSDALHRQFLFYRNFAETWKAGKTPSIYITHLPFVAISEANVDINSLNCLLLLRDPGAVALALARSFYDLNTTRADHLYLREHASFEEIVHKVVTGYSCEGVQFAPLAGSLQRMAADWRQPARFVLRFEEITARLGGSDSELIEYFRPVLESMFEEVPADSAARIRAAASPQISASYSRTKNTPYDNIQPQDVYSLVRDPARRLLRKVADELGYPIEGRIPSGLAGGTKDGERAAAVLPEPAVAASGPGREVRRARAAMEHKDMKNISAGRPKSGPIVHRFPYSNAKNLLGQGRSRFVVTLFTGRTGTTFVQHSLNQHPEIRFEGEFLAEFRNEPNGAEVQADVLKNFFERGARDNRVHAFKTKMQDVRDPSTLRRYITENRCLVVHSYRNNLIKQCISGERSIRLVEEAKKNSGMTLPYNLTANSVARGVKALGMMRAEKRKLDGAIAYFKKGADLLREFLESLDGIDVIDIAYEDLNANKPLVLNSLIAYMGLRPIEWEETILKHTADNLKDVIDNFDEIAAMYRGTEYYQMFFTDAADAATPAGG